MSSWTDKRPMSPHVSIWKWHITMAGSILHRITGVALYAGMFLVVAWLFAAAAGPDLYEPLSGLIGTLWGQLILFGFTLAVIYHLLSGVRHLVWDAGFGFQPKFASFIGALIVVLTAAISVAIWLLLGLVPGVDLLRAMGGAQ